MTLAAFLAELRRRGIELWAEGGHLRCTAPAGALTTQLRDELKRRKDEILEFFRSAEALVGQPRAIVPLQAGGARLPVFGVPGHNGDVFCYRALAHALGAEQPFYGLQPPGSDGREAPLKRVEALAGYFASQIRAVRPKGPIVLAGFCAGGAVAFELARQLTSGGAEVDFLALFGSPYPSYFRLSAQLRQRMGQRLARFRALAALEWSQRLAHMSAVVRARLGGRDAPSPAPRDAVLALRARVERATLRAVRRYTPGSFAGRVVLFLPSPSWAKENLALRWRRAARRVEEFYGPEGCTNDTMLLAPHAPLFADFFRCSVASGPEVCPQHADAAALRAA